MTGGGRSQLNLHVELVDPAEEYDVTADGRDLRRWEAVHDDSYFRTSSSVTQTTQIGYHAAVRCGLFDGTWEAFDARCVGVTFNRAEPVIADPTEPGVTADSYAT